MKAMVNSRMLYYVRRAGIMLTIVALIMGIVGCGPSPVVRYDLAISSTDGGEVTVPGEGVHGPYDAGTVVNLVAEPEEGYEFAGWTGDVETVADVDAAETTITMNGDYSITANFAIAIVEIRTWHDLDAVRENLGGSYVLMNDLDSATAGYTELAGMTANGGKGWEPIGTGVFDELDPEEPYTRLDPFTGTFDGQGYEIGDLFINRPDEYAVGLFGVVDEGGVIKDVGVVNVAVTGGSGVGGLVGGNLYGSTVNNAYVTGSVMGVMGVGGLVGGNGYGGIVSNSYSTASVTGDEGVGGLAGFNAYDAVVNSAFASGIVTGDWAVGGLVGVNEEGNVRDSYSRGHVSGIGNVGGLAGWSSGTVNRSYSSGTVIGEVYVGGLIGQAYQGTVDSSFWDVGTSGTEASDGGIGKTTAEMMSMATFAAATWDITAVAFGETDGAYTWNIVDGQSYPFLGWQAETDMQEIRTWHDLDAMRNNPAGHYVLVNDLDLTTPGYEELASATANGGRGWEPIGGIEFDPLEQDFEVFDPFVGVLDGQGYEIRDLYINRPDEDGVGLFGAVEGSIANIGIAGAAVTGGMGVGALVGANTGSISFSYSTGSVSGEGGVGGLAGGNGLEGKLSNSYSNAAVTGMVGVGGLAGGNVWGSAIVDCYSTGGVTGDLFAGGLVGINDGSTITSSFSTGSVAGSEDVGGLVGATFDGGTVSDSFWDVEASGMEVSAAGTGKTTAEMMSIATFAAAMWDITAVAFGETDGAYTWNIVDGQSYPFLNWEEPRDEYESVYFACPNLEAVVREAIGKPTGGIYPADLEGLTELEAEGRSITDLTGLDYCINLTYLWLCSNQISDVSPLAGLTRLEVLDLDSNEISDISPVAGLSSLLTLDLGYNRISDIEAVSGLTQLWVLYLGGNEISDITPLSGLANLGGGTRGFYLIVEGQAIHLDLCENQIADISALVSNEGLQEGAGVDLRWNPLSDESIDEYIPALRARGVTVFA